VTDFRAAYPSLLRDLYSACAPLVCTHEPHEWMWTPPARRGYEPVPELWRCAPDGNTVCDELGNLLWNTVNAAFHEEDAEQWLEVGPSDLLDWYVDGGLETPRAAIIRALQYDAVERLDDGHGWLRVPAFDD
jgi:hypothetical protein